MPKSTSVEFLYQDDHILAVNKPPGLLSVPGGYEFGPTDLVTLLEPSEGRLWTVHRLDGDTSGVIIFARTAFAHAHLNTQFEERRVAKLYHALIRGTPEWTEIEASFPLKVDGDRRHRTIVDTRLGKPAETSFQVLQAFHGFTLLEARPHTGYTHQIRVHLARLGFPLAGDPLYADQPGIFLSELKRRYKLAGKEQEPPLLGRTALHARQITFIHPFTGGESTITAPYPKDFAVTVKQLQKYAI